MKYDNDKATFIDENKIVFYKSLLELYPDPDIEINEINDINDNTEKLDKNNVFSIEDDDSTKQIDTSNKDYKSSEETNANTINNLSSKLYSMNNNISSSKDNKIYKDNNKSKIEKVPWVLISNDKKNNNNNIKHFGKSSTIDDTDKIIDNINKAPKIIKTVPNCFSLKSRNTFLPSVYKSAFSKTQKSGENFTFKSDEIEINNFNNASKLNQISQLNNDNIENNSNINNRDSKDTTNISNTTTKSVNNSERDISHIELIGTNYSNKDNDDYVVPEIIICSNDIISKKDNDLELKISSRLDLIEKNKTKQTKLGQEKVDSLKLNYKDIIESKIEIDIQNNMNHKKRISNGRTSACKSFISSQQEILNNLKKVNKY